MNIFNNETTVEQVGTNPVLVLRDNSQTIRTFVEPFSRRRRSGGVQK